MFSFSVLNKCLSYLARDLKFVLNFGPLYEFDTTDTTTKPRLTPMTYDLHHTNYAFSTHLEIQSLSHQLQTLVPWFFLLSPQRDRQVFL